MFKPWVIRMYQYKDMPTWASHAFPILLGTLFLILLLRVDIIGIGMFWFLVSSNALLPYFMVCWARKQPQAGGV